MVVPSSINTEVSFTTIVTNARIKFKEKAPPPALESSLVYPTIVL